MKTSISNYRLHKLSFFNNPGASRAFTFIFSSLLIVAIFINFIPANAATTLTVTPITWDVIGLDSNNVNVGPNHFPVGVRVCNTGASAAADVTATFVWDFSDAYINNRPGTDSSLSVSTLAIGACTDFYFEVEVTRDEAAYENSRRYHIEVTADSGVTNAVTPTPRELFVERLISQSRNSTNDVQLSTDGATYTSIPKGGTMTLIVGNTYYIKLIGSTATNGYEQIESFVNLPNTIFQVLDVQTEYTADTSDYVSNPSDKLYGDGCYWENNTGSPNYRSCLSTGKVGGDTIVTYKVEIVSAPSDPLLNPQALSTLIYDYSGSSYHYNSDFSGSTRYVYILEPSDVAITKSFTPDSIVPDGTSMMTIRITNPDISSIPGVNFIDDLPDTSQGAPGDMVVASTPNLTYAGCGASPSPSSLSGGEGSISFSNITLSPSSVCTIKVNVTAAPVGTYTNTTNNLFINTSVDTGNTASATLTVTSEPDPCISDVVLASWTVSTTATLPPDTSSPVSGSPTDMQTNVGNPQASSAGAAITYGIHTADMGGVGVWYGAGYAKGTTGRNTGEYFQFTVDTTLYKDITWNFQAGRTPNGPLSFVIYYTPNGGSEVQIGSVVTFAAGDTLYSYSNAISSGYLPAGDTVFRIYPYDAFNTGMDSRFDIDEINFVGTTCSPPPPTLAKSFGTDPIKVNTDISTLTFSIGNTSVTPASEALTGVNFNDTLPAGLFIASPANASTTCPSGSLSAPAGGTTISLSGASMAAGSTCSVVVDIMGTVAGTFDNVSDYIGATESGQNKTSTGFAADSITVLSPPFISKVFGAETILTNSTTSLSFNITNPNLTTALTNVQFVDSLPAGLEVATPNGLTGSCGGGSITAAAGSTSVSLSGAELLADSSCTFSLNVKGTSAGTKLNTTGNISSDNGGVGNTASDTLEVKDASPALGLLKQVGETASGPWYASRTIAAGSQVYYKFTVENIGDVQLISIGVEDPDVNTSGCSWTDPLPVAVAANENHITTCVVGPVSATTGSKTNTARAFGTYSSTVYSNYDSATYENGNFGHLPSAYTNMNLYNDGGAMHLNCSAFLGASVTTTDLDGINTPEYTPKSTDDGVTWTPGVNWSVGSGGSVDVTVTCPSEPCYLNAWFDWNKDNDFSDPGEQVFTNQAVNNGLRTLTFSIPAGTTLDGKFYSRFRLYDALPANPLPNGKALDGSGNSLCGEIEDPWFNISGGVVTPVTLSYFNSVRDGSTIQFEWSTATESGNIGFNLYVETEGRTTLVNKHIIPSQAIDSLARQDYIYSAEVNGDVFFIEDVSVTGEVRRHGPFDLGLPYGDRLDEDVIDTEAVLVEHTAKSSGRQEQLKHEMKMINPSLNGVSLDKNDLYMAPSINFKVRQTGIYRVTYEMLREAGLDLLGTPVAKLTLMNRNRSVPVQIVSTGAGFGPGGYIEFFGQALDTIYTDTNVYTLKLTHTSARRIKLKEKAIVSRVKPQLSYSETVLVDNQRAYANYAPGDDAWYDTSLFVYKTSESWDFPVYVSGLADPSAEAALELVVWGVTDWPQNPDHHLVVHFNGIQVADQTFDGLVEKVMIIKLPAGVVQEGENTLTLTLPGDLGPKYDMMHLDKYSLTYQRLLQAENGKLTFSGSAKKFKVANLQSDKILVYRLGAKKLVRLSRVNVKDTGTEFKAKFSGSKKNAQYFITTEESLLVPELEFTSSPKNLQQSAQYLVISHPDFIDGLEPLLDAHRANGLTVNVVDVRDLYNEYTYGVFDPKAIKQHISFAAEHLGAEYVLLVGGDTYDYRNYLGINSVSFIPSLYTQTGSIAKMVPVDPLFADLDGDNVPDLAIGRFPVRNSAELDMMISKTLSYGGKDYARTAVFVSDKYDGVVSFKDISARLASRMPAGWAIEKIDMDDVSLETARTQLITAMNRGTSLVTFTGHSGPSAWTFKNMFNRNHAAYLTNAGRPFVVVQWGCWNTYYVDPVNNHLVQSLLFSGDRGAASVLGAVTLTDSNSERMLGELLTPQIVKPGMTIGQALQTAKSQLAQSNPELLDVLLGWTLMGDPAMVMDR